MIEDAQTPSGEAPSNRDGNGVDPIASVADSSTSEEESITFSRCASCRHAEELDRAAGTLLCAKHDMRINAEADEIPDDCPDYDPAEPS